MPCRPPTEPHRISYTTCCCGADITPSEKFPVSGSFEGSGFVLKDTNPYLFDTTYTKYGQMLCFSEHIYTNVSQRKDPSCINLSATFDMVDTNLTNETQLDLLEKYIGKKYSSLNGVLPIMKNGIKFKIHYFITDHMGGEVYTGEIVSTSLDTHFHFTDIQDRFITSARNVVIDMIPTLPSDDVYTLIIDRVEAFVEVIDVAKYTEEGVNPFYKFTSNNAGIILNNAEIKSCVADAEICIAYCDVNKSFCFNSNINTRLRMSFTAYMSTLIVTADTSEIWACLDSPTEEIIDELSTRVDYLEESVKTLCEMIERQDLLIQKLRTQIDHNTASIEALEKIVNTTPMV